MSRTYTAARHRHRNKHINGEIWGRSDFKVGPDDKIFPRGGGDPVGSPGGKKSAKNEANRARRRRANYFLRLEAFCRDVWGD